LAWFLEIPTQPQKAFSTWQEELVKEKAAPQTTQIEVETLTQAVRDLKILADSFVAQIPILKEKVKHLDNKVTDGLNELQAQELSMERITKVNEDYKN
jgi:hypothetical protein